jgi:hypothetical protein
MVHLRLNETETNPNPHVNFITALNAVHHEDKEAARQLLRALAAQVRPVMKSYGFVINSFEEVRAIARSENVYYIKHTVVRTQHGICWEKLE